MFGYFADTLYDGTQLPTCRHHPEHSPQIWRLDTDWLSAHVGHEASARTDYPHVLTIRYAQQVQGLYQGQAVRYLQGQELCNKGLWPVVRRAHLALYSTAHRTVIELQPTSKRF